MNRGRIIVAGMILAWVLAGCGTRDITVNENVQESGWEGMGGTAENGSDRNFGKDEAIGQSPEETTVLSQEEKAFFTDFVQKRENYGFLLSDYDTPGEVDLQEVLYCGADFGEPIPQEDVPLYLAAAQKEFIETDCVKFPRQDLETFLEKKMGIGLGEVSRPFEWLYIPELDAYFHEAGDSNYVYFSCTAGERQGDIFILRFSPVNEWDQWLGERETVLVKTEEGYRFLSNHVLEQ